MFILLGSYFQLHGLQINVTHIFEVPCVRTGTKYHVYELERSTMCTNWNEVPCVRTGREYVLHIVNVHFVYHNLGEYKNNHS